MRARPRLRTILLWVNLIVLLMPLAAVVGLRLYETELIRRTEAEVLSQTALIKATYETLLHDELGDLDSARDALAAPPGGELAAAKWPTNFEDRFRPVPINIDLRRDEILPPPAPPRPPAGSVHTAAKRAGSRLEPILVEAQKMTMSGMRVVDLYGNVLASSQQNERERSVGHHVDVQRALQGEFVKILRARKAVGTTTLAGLARSSGFQVVVSIPVLVDGRVVGAVTAWRTPIGLLKGLYENRGIFGVLLGSFLLAILAISAITSVYIGRPIQRLMAQTQKVAEGADGADAAAEVIKKPGTYEVQKLSESVHTMAGTLQSRAEYIRTFATNVSHEFKTPLTTIRGTVELLQDHLETMPDAQRTEFLDMLDADAKRLERLVTRLLELARADVLRPGDESCDVSVLLEELVETGSAQGIDVLLADEDTRPPLRAAISPAALESVFSNLLGNSAQHGAHELHITLHADPDQITLTLADDGPGISEANAKKIFNEFFTTRRDAGGTGLGLAIVRTMLRGHGGDIEWLPADTGATFRIRLPRRT